MTGRVFWIEVRRSAARWAALVSLPLVIFASSDLGRGSGVLAAGHRQALVLFVPLALGVGAWQARRDRRSNMEELLTTTPRPAWHRRLVTAGALTSGAIVGAWFVYALLTGYIGLTGGFVSPSGARLFGVSILYLVAAVLTGLAVGRLVPWALTPPLLTLGGFVLMILPEALLPVDSATNSLPGRRLLIPTEVGGVGRFETLTAAALSAQAIWAAGLVTAALLLAVATRNVRIAAVLPVAASLVVVLPLLPAHARDAVVLDASATAMVCTDDAPVVCVTAVSRPALAGLREPARRALGILREKLPQAPTSVSEAVFDARANRFLSPGQASVLYAEVPTLTRTGRIAVPEDDLVFGLLIGAGTRPCPFVSALSPQERVRYDTARVVAALWLLGETPQSVPRDPTWWWWLPGEASVAAAYARLLALPADDQVSRVAGLRAAELVCSPGDRLDALVGDGA